MKLEAKTRLQITSFTPNSIGRSGEDRVRRDFKNKQADWATLRARYRTLETFDDFQIEFCKWGSFSSDFVVTSGGVPVGILRVHPKDKQVVASLILPQHQGKGLGVRLYKAALKVYGVLRSSNDLSAASSALWAVLCKKLNGSFVIVTNGKRVSLKPVGYVVGKHKVTYPVFVRDSTHISLEDLLKNQESRSSQEAAAGGYYEIKK